MGFPFASPTMKIFLINIIELLYPSSDCLYLISGGNFPKADVLNKIIIKDIGISMHYVESVRPFWWSVFLWGFKNIQIQLKMAMELVKLFKNTDIIFFCGTSYYVPSMLISKLFRKKTVVLVWGMGYMSEKQSGKSMFSHILKPFEIIMLKFADIIDLETQSAISFLNLIKYDKEGKVTIGGLYIDDSIFYQKKEIEERENIIGYVGRLQEEKGILNYVDAVINLLKSEKSNYKVWIIGDGPLYNEINEKVEKNDLSEYIILHGWISHEELPDYLNDLKLMILPSYSEGVPSIIQEAMSCGTPVLSTPVGGIPDLITDGVTGFIMENNSPECIEKNILRVLKKNNLNLVIIEARNLVKNKYAYDKMVKRYNIVLQKLMD
jgi:glycosyltransferase involved in cell wall biosynthesis